MFKQHINEHDGPKRESSEETSSEDSSKENCVGGKYCFEPNLSLRSFQHTSVCTETKENSQSVSSLEESATCSSDFKQTAEAHWYYCAECSYKSKIKNYLKLHIENSHSNKRFACDKCSYKSRRKADLKIHI